MKTLAFAILTLALATPVMAQTTSGQTRPPTSGDLTRMLNGAPPATVTLPASPVERSTVAPTPARPAETAPVSPPSTPRIERPTSVTHSAGPAIVERPGAATTRPATSTSTPPSVTTPAAAAVAQPPVRPASAPTVLNAAAIADLPFSLELPAGFQIVTGRPGPDFKVYTVRRGDKPFVMIYAGPSSQFPIYDGEMAVAGGRTSVVVVEGAQRRALEHLFTSPTAPRELHVWVSSLDGADRALGERIAQSVDAR